MEQLQVYCKTLDSKYDVFTASRDIDTLTFNRIRSIGYENLTDYQKEILKIVCERQAKFRFDNSEIFESNFKSYRIGDVSMTLDLDNSNLVSYNGIKMEKGTYELLRTTGLCSRII